MTGARRAVGCRLARRMGGDKPFAPSPATILDRVIRASARHRGRLQREWRPYPRFGAPDCGSRCRLVPPGGMRGLRWMAKPSRHRLMWRARATVLACRAI